MEQTALDGTKKGPPGEIKGKNQTRIGTISTKVALTALDHLKDKNNGTFGTHHYDQTTPWQEHWAGSYKSTRS
jgi:hypothetical protein